MDGTIRTANPNFLEAMGYTLAEVQGKHHGMFVEPSEPNARIPRVLGKLNDGQYQAAEYKRIGKGGREIWIQASYNPILDLNGKPFKVVKYATDVTVQAVMRRKAENARSLIETAAAGSEEMSASIREISETMTKSKANAAAATGRIDAADLQAQKLNDAAKAMSGIVELIGNITGQINLLALNATIEFGARGRGWQGICRRRIRGKKSGKPGQTCHRHDLEGNRGAQWRCRRCRRIANRHQGCDRGCQRIHHLHRCRRRGTEHCDTGYVDHHAEGFC